ncbi:hypothetical protein HYH03_001591 [Edaphochlamys debaryana]|uniref:J domain-containing protein n=1 Tax=Edaphochlamys debaryana TaxID=47281 RepID=A0A836C6E1_9CHLO|nr:hypothetical protein HYH03_001591 [Edaphochlamys debaryana]|eukprot:KAG2500829.1 hypothetical protein HYH03_001591 [Edaphochlamys debaryana]
MSARRFISLLGRRDVGELAAAARWAPFAASASGAIAADACQPSTSAPSTVDQLLLRLARGAPAASLPTGLRWAHDHACTSACTHEDEEHKESAARPQSSRQRPSRPLDDAAAQHASGRARPVTLEELEKACWSCDKHVKRGGLVCHGCETVQPPDDSLNYFDLFSLPLTFDLAPAFLEKRYKALQWNLHPDKMGHKAPEEREFSAQQAALVNLAYSILKAPLSRANYMLMLRGISAGDNHEGTIEDPELLMQVLEAREEVEDTSDPATLSALLARNRAQQEGLVGQLSAAFRDGDERRAVGLVTQLQYLAKLEAEIIKKLPQL